MGVDLYSVLVGHDQSILQKVDPRFRRPGVGAGRLLRTWLLKPRKCPVPIPLRLLCFLLLKNLCFLLWNELLAESAKIVSVCYVISGIASIVWVSCPAFWSSRTFPART